MKRFVGRVAVITGGADGLGKGIAERLVAEGCKVVLWDFNADKGAATEAELKAAGGEAEFVKVDISSEESVVSAYGKLDKLDIVINCAGIVGPTGLKAVDVKVADFQKVSAVNITGSFLVTKYALPLMIKNNYGRILLVASVAGKEGNAGMAAYSTSKAAVIGMIKSIGKEYAETGITVNGLAPAVVRTAMVEAMPAEQVKYMTDKIPMKRCATIAEVAATAAYIVSEEASFNTATVFDLTGGRATY